MAEAIRAVMSEACPEPTPRHVTIRRLRPRRGSHAPSHWHRGIFFKAQDPGALRSWYREHLGVDVLEWAVP